MRLGARCAVYETLPSGVITVTAGRFRSLPLCRWAVGLAEIAGKVAYSAQLSQLLAMGTSVVNVDSTSMTEAVGLATVI